MMMDRQDMKDSPLIHASVSLKVRWHVLVPQCSSRGENAGELGSEGLPDLGKTLLGGPTLGMRMFFGDYDHGGFIIYQDHVFLSPEEEDRVRIGHEQSNHLPKLSRPGLWRS